jgi:16S rRNA (guanine(1405)-N(7))-methyltransferase
MKYKNLYAPLVERIFFEEAKKKDPTKAAKTRLHQLYGAYLNGNSHKRAERVFENENLFFEEQSENFTRHHDFAKTNEILNLHTSTKERLPHYKNFFELISNHATEIKKICDLGCGFNPFAIPLMPAALTENLVSYRAYDIDLRTKALLNRFFALIGLPQGADCADLAVETPNENADLTFMLKLVPVLEAQSPRRGFELANALDTRVLVISYPLKSLGGREKGMEKNYSAAFENAVASGFLNNFKPIANEIIGNELVFILERVM